MRYEVTPHRMPGGVLCPASMTVGSLPNGCPNGCGTPRFNMALADAAPSRLEVTHAVLRCLAYGEDMPADLSAETVNVHPYWDAVGVVVLRMDVTRHGQTFTYTITVDGDL
jgi:hypothetical protein